MKKIYILSILSIVLLTSCGEAPCEKYEHKLENHPEYYAEFEDVFEPDGENKCRIYVNHMEYAGHKYLIFGRGHGKTIVHDPDCPCHSRWK